MYMMDIPMNESNNPNPSPQSNRRRRKKSMVWEHFTVEPVDADCIKATCNQCKKSFAYIKGTRQSGTSHLKRHIDLGICPVGRLNRQGKEQLSPPLSQKGISANSTNLPSKRIRASKRTAGTHFDGDNGSYKLAKMIVQHDYPIHIVEQSRFIDFARALQPQFDMSSVGEVQEQIKGIYFREKQRILDLLSGVSGCLSLTVDLWTSNQNLTYVHLTGHFVDSDWKLQRRVFSFITVPFPDSDMTFKRSVGACLTDWSSEGKLLTVVLDRSCSNDNARENVRKLLSIQNPHILKGQLLIKSCYARTLRSLALDAIGLMRGTIEKVRHSVKYVKTSEAREERFIELKQRLQVPCTKNLMIDDCTKWNTTYQMLLAASELKQVFSCLDTVDPDYKSTPSMEEWRQVETLCGYLKTFYELANRLTSPIYPTTNIFYEDIWRVQFELMQASGSHDFFVRTLTKPLQERFTKYWEDCNLVLAVAVVMDPRFKIEGVKFSFSRIYGEDSDEWIKIVKECLNELYCDYLGPARTILDNHQDLLVKTEESFIDNTFLYNHQDPLLKKESSGEDVYLSNGDDFLSNDNLFNGDDFLSELDICISDYGSSEVNRKSELDQYLEEDLLPRNQEFDVLGWWKGNRFRYPVLSRLASDLLSIPISTVPSECVFDTRDRKLDNHHSCLKPTTLQAVICAKDWLRHESSEVPFHFQSTVSSAFVKTEL